MSENQITINRSKLEHLYKVSRIGLGVGFVLVILMLFHVLIDFFYHT